jgi:glycosyltransferase involved in cell wall biosynthesis
MPTRSQRAEVALMQFHILSFEGPDDYSRAGGLGTRVEGLSETLAALGFETHLWFVGDPDLPGEEQRGFLHLHRWCQWVSRHHPGGVYDGEPGKTAEFAHSLPPHLLRHYVAPHVRAGGRAVILAEEWQTADAVLHLDRLLREAGIRQGASMLWNANNTFGFECIDWKALSRAARITTVSRYMKHRMREWGVESLVIPNGLSSDSFDAPCRWGVKTLRGRFRDRTVITKMARWDPDKRWLATVRMVAEMKRQGWRPLLVARGGAEPHGTEVLEAAADLRLRVVERTWVRPGGDGLLSALNDVGDADVVNLRSHVDPHARRVLFRGSDAVLANSGHEPFGLVGLEAMAVGGVACTGCSGEDYAVPGQNAIVLETDDAREFMTLYSGLRADPDRLRRLRRAGQSTARRYAWQEVALSVLLPRVELTSSAQAQGVTPAAVASTSGSDATAEPHPAPTAPARSVRSARSASGSDASSWDGARVGHRAG